MRTKPTKEQMKAYYWKNRGRINQNRRTRVKSGLATPKAKTEDQKRRTRERRAAWNKKNPANSDAGKNSSLVSRYGITLNQYQQILKLQGNACAICGSDLIESGLCPHVDHEHAEPFAIRGVLCGPCNQGLGMFKESPHALRAAAAYLHAPPVLLPTRKRGRGVYACSICGAAGHTAPRCSHPIAERVVAR